MMCKQFLYDKTLDVISLLLALMVVVVPSRMEGNDWLEDDGGIDGMNKIEIYLRHLSCPSS